MTTHNPWDVIREFATMQDRMNRIWGSMYDRGTDDVTSRGSWLPRVDIYETASHEIVLKAEAPGLRREDIDLTVENNTLTIRGERKKDEGISEDRYHRVERSYGNFARSFAVPNSFDTDKINAGFKNGVLTVSLPKKEAAKPRQVKIEAVV